MMSIRFYSTSTWSCALLRAHKTPLKLCFTSHLTSTTESDYSTMRILNFSIPFWFTVSALLLLRCEVTLSLLAPSASKERTKLSHRADSSVSFKKGGDDEDNKPVGMLGWFASFKSKLMNSAGVPVPDTANRYHIRIRDLNNIQGRHVVTRLMRYFPDLTWETANDIVETAFVNEIALVRIVNSVREAELAVDMLRKADPPIPAEIWDSKTEEVMMI